MRKIFVQLISYYQAIVSPDTGMLVKIGIKKSTVCVFYPSCSEYTKQAIIKYGVFAGCLKGARRITRCHPWQKNRIDHLT